MKNRLLTLAVLIIVAVSGFAGSWVPPTPKSAAYTSGNKYYFYNTGAGQFLTKGNAWGTQASFGVTGLEAIVSDTLWNKELKSLGVVVKFTSNSKYLFIDNSTTSYVDMASQGHNFWKFNWGTDGTYTWQIHPDDITYGATVDEGAYASCYFGWDGKLNSDGSHNNTVALPLIDLRAEGFENAKINWMLVDSLSYAVYQAKYALYQVLKQTEAWPTVSTTDAEKVYLDASATIEALKAATLGLNQAIEQARFDSATTENPADLTYKITTADCSSFTGWTNNGFAGPQSATHTNSENGVTIQNFLEKWVAHPAMLPNAGISQTITNLPNGRYTLKADAIACYQDASKPTVKGVSLYADGGSYNDIECSTLPGTPQNFMVNFTVLNGLATIGFKVENTNANWVAVDNFKLIFYGKDANIIKTALAETVAKANLLVEDGGKMGNPARESLESMISYANEVYGANVTDDSVTVVIAQLNARMDSIKVDIKAYAQLLTSIQKANTRANDFGNTFDLNEFMDFVMLEAEIPYEDGTLTTAQAVTMVQTLEDLFQSSVRKSMKPGDDITPLIANAHFEKNASGWLWETNGPTGAFACAEVYNKVSNVYQILENLPQGSYTLKVQALYRTESNANAYNTFVDNSADVRCYIYGNQFETKVNNIFAGLQNTPKFGTEAQAGTYPYDFKNAAGTYSPNSMEGTSKYFAAGLYDNALNVLVTDGTLRLGIKITDPIKGDSWALFDNFRLIYNGNQVSGYAEAIHAKIAEAQAILDQDTKMSVKASDDITQSMLNGQDALAGTSPQACIDALADLDSTILAARTSINKVKELESLMMSLEIRMLDVDSNYDGFMNAWETADNKLQGGSNSFATDQEITQIYTLLETEFTKCVQYPVLQTATLETPGDLTAAIYNAGFTFNGEDSFAGWQNPGKVAYSEMECWNTNFDVCQTIRGLAPGFYRLSVQGSYRAGNAASAAKARTDSIDALNAYLYVGEYKTPLMSAFEEVQSVAFASDDISTNLGYVPNSMEGVSAYFAAGKYADNVIDFEVKANETEIKLGVKKEILVGDDWTIWDSFKLLYLGATAPDAVGVIENAGATVDRVQYFTTDGIQVNRPVKGVTIVKKFMTDGTVQVVKIGVK